MTEAISTRGGGADAGSGKLALALALLGCVVFLFNVANARNTASLKEMHSSWRYWDDMALAADLWAGWSAGAERGAAPPVYLDDALPEFRAVVKRQTRRAGIRPWQFWRALPRQPLAKNMPRLVPPPHEDAGRSVLLAIGFFLVGGVAPYLGLWIAVLPGVAALFWLAWELNEASHPVAAATLPLALAFSPFFVEALSLPHSAIGFYIVGLIALSALATYAVLGRCRSRPRFAARLILGALCFAAGSVSRGSTLALAPALLLSLFWAARRVFGAPRDRARSALVALAVALALLVPYLLVRPGRAHNVWLGMWEGLGDYGTDRGFSWYDVDAQQALSKAGIEPFANPRLVNAEHERFFRSEFLAAITKHPVWYAGVLLKRTGATLGLRHLWPWRPLGGESLETPRFHYKYTTPVDWLGAGGQAVELPVPVLLLPGVFLAIAGLRARRRGQADTVRRLVRFAATGAIVALGALPVPVVISTASALETQAIAIAYFLLGALTLDEIVCRRRTGAATVSESRAT